MPQINSIKEMARDGQSVAGIARELTIDEKTVRKYLNQEDFSPQPPEEVMRPSKLNPHKSLIDTWLKEDEGRWHKQRHTAKRIHDRLKAESPGYDCAYNAVQRYVKDALRAQRALKASQERAAASTSGRAGEPLRWTKCTERSAGSSCSIRALRTTREMLLTS